MADTPHIISVTRDICQGCHRSNHPRDVNEVTLALANIECKDKGPGTTLHNTITWFIAQPEGCNCPNRVKLMNAWGWDRCRREARTILGWLRESALDSGMGYSEYTLASVVKTLFYKKPTP